VSRIGNCAVSQRGHLIARTWSRQELGRLGDETMTKSVDGVPRQLSWLKLSRPSNLAVAFLRLALGAGFLSAVADRMGFWGPPGTSLVSWGNFHNFVLYTAKLNPWCPAACLPLLGVSVTIAEAGLGILLILGLSTRVAALLTGMIALAFADFRARSSRAPELLRFRILGSVLPSCIAGPRQPDHRSISRLEGPAPRATTGFTRQLKT